MELIHMRPSRSVEWTEVCKECDKQGKHKMIKASGFNIKLSVAWDSTPDDDYFLCKACARKLYPNYFKKGKTNDILYQG